MIPSDWPSAHVLAPERARWEAIEACAWRLCRCVTLPEAFAAISELWRALHAEARS